MKSSQLVNVWNFIKIILLNLNTEQSDIMRLMTIIIKWILIYIMNILFIILNYYYDKQAYDIPD